MRSGNYNEFTPIYPKGGCGTETAGNGVVGDLLRRLRKRSPELPSVRKGGRGRDGIASQAAIGRRLLGGGICRSASMQIARFQRIGGIPLSEGCPALIQIFESILQNPNVFTNDARRRCRRFSWVSNRKFGSSAAFDKGTPSCASKAAR